MTLSERDDVNDDVGALPQSDARHESSVPGRTEEHIAEVLARGEGPCVGVVQLHRLTERDTPAHAEWATFRLPKYAAEDPPDWPARVLAALPSVPQALGDYLEHLPPGKRLATLLAAIDEDEVDDYSLVEVVAAYKRMEAWSAARAARAAAALAERPALNPTWPGTVPGRTRGECVVGEELAMRLRISRLTAVRIASSGRAFGRMFQLTGEALEQGAIDWPRAQAIVAALEDLPTDVAVAAQWEVLDTAPGRTLRQVQQDLARAVIAVDPDHADERYRAARTKRCVHRPRALPDGMARVSATLPASDAIALDLALDASARAAKTNGDKRTLDQLRADSLALMGHAALACGAIGPLASGQCTCGCGADAPPDGSALPGSATEAPPGDPATRESDSRTVAVVAPPPGQSPPPGTAVGSAHRTGERPAHPGTAFTRPVSRAARPPYPGHRLPEGALPTVRLGMLAGGRADIRITVPLGVLLPDPDAAEQSPLDRLPEPVAELEGFGPVPPVVARALAAGGTWRRLVTDPANGQVLDVGRTRYQPTAAIADHVRERDCTCSRPGCPRPARSSELDHEHEWQHGGVTSVENLDPDCSRDHVVKSIGAYTVAHGSDRTYAWAGPTGHGYLRRPDGTIVTMPRRSAEGLRALGRESVRTRRAIDPAYVDAVLAEISAGTDVGGSWAPAGRPSTASPWPGVPEGPSWAADDDPPF